MKEHITKQIERLKAENDNRLKASVPCFTEIDYNRGMIDGLRYALALIEKYEADERLLNSDWGDMEVDG